MEISDRNLFRTLATCRHLVKSSFMAMNIFIYDYGTFKYTSGSFLELLGYTGAVYEFSALPYMNDAGEIIPSALTFIGDAIEKKNTYPEMYEYTALSEVFGPDQYHYRSLIEIPYQFDSPTAKRSQFIIKCWKRYQEQITSTFNSFGGDHREILDKSSRNITKLLSDRLYGKDVISNEHYKNNCAFLQEVIEEHQIQEKEIFG